MNYFKKCGDILKQEGIGIFPTDTAFAISCRMDSQRALERLFSIRQRPQTQAVSILLSAIDMALPFISEESLTQPVLSLMHDYWPGGLTIVLPCHKARVLPLVRGQGSSLGLRIPDHPIAKELISDVGVPLIGPSANIHGKPTPYFYADLDPQLTAQVDFVIEGECVTMLASTVIDCSTSPWKIIRPGSVEINQEKYGMYFTH